MGLGYLSRRRFHTTGLQNIRSQRLVSSTRVIASNRGVFTPSVNLSVKGALRERVRDSLLGGLSYRNLL